MCPQKLIFGLTLYDLLIALGIILCFCSFSYLADKRRIKGRLQNLVLISGVAGISLGFGSAILFQAFYNVGSTGKFEIVANTGATFYGGLIGGVLTFLVCYFAAGHLLYKRSETPSYPKDSFFAVASCAVPSILLAHGFGRLGCLMAGCCHGALTDAWYGLQMYGRFGYEKYVPIQLFEAIFLLSLFAILFYRAKREKRYNLPVYITVYGIWRFLIEFARADDRGSLPFWSLSPSQFIAVLMILCGIGIFFLEKRITDRQEASSVDERDDEAKEECDHEKQ